MIGTAPSWLSRVKCLWVCLCARVCVSVSGCMDGCMDRCVCKIYATFGDRANVCRDVGDEEHSPSDELSCCPNDELSCCHSDELSCCPEGEVETELLH